MFAKTTAFLALFAVATRVAIAVPPACLVAAVNTQSDPSAISTVCKGGASDVEAYITKNCGNAADAAMSAFQSVCKDAGVTISSSSSSSSSSGGSSTTSSSATSSSSPDTTSSLTSSTATSATGSTTFETSTASAGSAGSASAGTSKATSTAASGSSGSGSGNSAATTSPATSTSSTTSTNVAARLGMDIVGMVALGIFGAMLAL